MADNPSPEQLARLAIPLSAQGTGDPPVWTMEHRRPHFLRVKFNRSAQSKLQRLPLDALYLALALGYVFVVWRLMDHFDVFDSVLLHIGAALFPVVLYIWSISKNDDLLVDTLVIDRQASHINGDGMSGRTSATFQCTLRERMTVHYRPGWMGARIVVEAGHMRFRMDRLAPNEDDLHQWIVAMLAKDAFVDSKAKIKKAKTKLPVPASSIEP